MKTCTHCGEENEKDHDVCWNCGFEDSTGTSAADFSVNREDSSGVRRGDKENRTEILAHKYDLLLFVKTVCWFQMFLCLLLAGGALSILPNMNPILALILALSVIGAIFTLYIIILIIDFLFDLDKVILRHHPSLQKSNDTEHKITRGMIDYLKLASIMLKPLLFVAILGALIALGSIIMFNS